MKDVLKEGLSDLVVRCAGQQKRHDGRQDGGDTLDELQFTPLPLTPYGPTP